MTRQRDADYRETTAISMRVSRRVLLKGAALGAGALLLERIGVTFAQGTGPSTTVEPYLLPSADGVEMTAILTVGDLPAQNGYRMVGIPDGLGAFSTGGGTFTVLMNHEIASSLGTVRGHGSRGAFVSQWEIERSSLRVLAGKDFAQSPNDVYQWDPVTSRYFQGTTAWDRHCSADLPDQKALRHEDRGTSERIFFNGEETAEGRAWARIVTGPNAGQVWQLPRLGRMAYENVVACPSSKEKTIVALLDDGELNTAPVAANNPSELFIYIGAKQQSGNPIERAGLTNGKLFGMRVYRGSTLITEEDNLLGLGDAETGYVGAGRFELVALGTNGDASDLTALQLEEDAIGNDIFRMLRIEDGAWDPRGSNEGDFYFVTTASFTQNSRLFRLHFDNIDRPEDGGSIEIILKGDEGHRMLDNMTVDHLGRVLLQEDPGNQGYLAKVWLYGIETGDFIEVAHHNPRFFDPSLASSDFMTQDEESSGVIPAQDILGEGWFLLDVQAHQANPDEELVQHGQLLAMYVHPQIGRRS